MNFTFHISHFTFNSHLYIYQLVAEQRLNKWKMINGKWEISLRGGLTG
jgi:hypothetical protein